MPKFIVKLTDDQGNREEYGNSGVRENFEERMKRVEENGSSHRMGQSAEDILMNNRAEEDESELTYEEIVKKYCHERPPLVESPA